ncbi:MAG: helix-turn-helix domain-containing protein, partial [Planctomycetota bacterium]
MPARTHKAFGTYLRKLRLRRGLSLPEVATLSREVTRPESKGAFGHPWLWQLEVARATAVSFAKLASLAEIYGEPIDKLIERAPDPQRARLRRTLAQWREAERDHPDRKLFPSRAPPLPRERAEVDQQLDAALAATARGVSLPLGMRDAHRVIREGLTWATLPAFLERMPNRAARLRQFWGQLSRVPDQSASDIPLLVSSMWHQTANAFRDAVLYDFKLWHALVSGLKSWAIDFSRPGWEPRFALLTCHYVAPDLEHACAADSVPVAALVELRSAQLALALDQATPADNPRRAPAPPLETAALETLRSLIMAGAFHPYESGVAAVAGAVRYVCEHVPALVSSTAPDPAGVGLAELLTRALADSAHG